MKKETGYKTGYEEGLEICPEKYCNDTLANTSEHTPKRFTHKEKHRLISPAPSPHEPEVYDYKKATLPVEIS